MSRASPLVKLAQELSVAVDALSFAPPVTHVYNPLTYAWDIHTAYLNRYGQGQKRVIFLGMNPGPFGMMQNGVPFGDIKMVTGWMGLSGNVTQPAHFHPKRPIEGLACPRSEVSGHRLWGLFAERYPVADDFFADHFVANYCPLAFLDDGRNLTPDKLPKAEQAPLLAACDAHLLAMAKVLQPQLVVGVGKFARTAALRALKSLPHIQVGDILHPSPASPLANKDWAGTAAAQLAEMGVALPSKAA